MRGARRDAGPVLYVLSATALSVILAIPVLAAAWRVSDPATRAVLSGSLAAVPVVSMTLAARGASWGRRVTYSLAIVAVALLFTGGFAAAWARLSAGDGVASGWASVLTTASHAVAVGGPIAVFVLFVGKDPSVLLGGRRR